MPRLLILGGTGEALALARAAAERRPDLSVVTSLAGRTRAPLAPPGEVRIGGFGGAEGLARYLAEQRIDALIDATHPFAARISVNAMLAANSAGVPRLMLLRPPWRRDPGDRWTEVPDLAAAAKAIPEGARCFLAVGRQELASFAARNDAWFLLRFVDPPAEPPPLAHCEVTLGRGPFAVEAEVELLRRQRISCLVAKNSGGAGGYAKLAAARQLDLPVLLVARPLPPFGDWVADSEAALAWLARVTC